MAAKRTHELIPLCHPLSLSFAGVEIEADEALPGVRVTTEMRLIGRTGVEMEALVAASVAALTSTTCARRSTAASRSAACACSKSRAERAATGGATGRSRDGGGRRGSVVSVNVAAAKGMRKGPVPRSASSPITASRATATPAPGTAR